MKKLKKLNHLESNLKVFQSGENLNEKFYDLKDDLLRDKHKGSYVMSHDGRVYISYKEFKEYQEERLNRKIIYRSFSSIAKESDFFTTEFSKYKKMLFFYIEKSNPTLTSKSSTSMDIKGFQLFLKILKSINIKFEDFNKIDYLLQNKIYDQFYNTKNLFKSNIRNLNRFFNNISKFSDTYLMSSFKNNSQHSLPRKGIPSSIIFQLDYFCEKELNENLEIFKKVVEWKKEYKNFILFSLENLAHTYYKSNQLNSIKFQVNKISKCLYKIDLKIWKLKKGSKYYYKDIKHEKEHKRLLKLSKKGVDISFKNEKMYYFWHITLFPNFPYDNKLNNKFNLIGHKLNSFRELYMKILKRKKLPPNLNKLFYVSREEIYVLFLFILIREGINPEVLKNWEVKKIDNTYTIGIETPSAYIIRASKIRSNSYYDTLIRKEHSQIKFIKSYLEHMKELYNNSNSSKFFQYYTRSNTLIQSNFNPIIQFDKSNWKSPTKSLNDFFTKYEIFDNEGNRINKINFSEIRPYYNYKNYLQGLNEYVRQHLMNHKDKSMTINHYENLTEWKESRNFKVAKIKDEIIGIFKGTISSSPLDKLFNGLISDCKNPQEPDYSEYINLKEDERCIDWFNCLNCSQAHIIPKIHGPVIKAWIDYMEEKEIDFIKKSDFEKEFANSLTIAYSVFNGFTNEEQIFAKKESSKYYDVVRCRFYKKVKLKQEGA
ncbi:hypothetical protein [Arcobacter sp. F2176]|uniref:hypothetical protein n=1 Tax=Arcobacter sp. F2176 TaxID=2044511 RepID=UPI00100A55FE|nr:hypothetical protein [Arcobacter sp. F2176]RXJ79348.1 hypothetical protein CRU95_14515 [Arcobacter sp. F2176]